MNLTVDDFDYPLPRELIAQAPLPERAGSRLLVADGARLEDRRIADLPQLLAPGDLLVMNDSRVLHARLLGHKISLPPEVTASRQPSSRGGKKLLGRPGEFQGSGGQAEVLVERVLNRDEVLAQVRVSKKLRPGGRLLLEDALEVEVLGREGEFYRLRFPGDAVELIERHGRLPLPPYIDRAAAGPDEERYQTVFARHKGSVAAPTAGLHFDEALLAALDAKGIQTAHVTLHVGAGTFQPVRVTHLSEHRMHSERYVLPQATVDAIVSTRQRGGRVVAVGTTSLRTLESAALKGELRAGEGETDLFVTPGFRFRVVDLLLTNFHLPKSTLLMLVCAFGGVDNIRAAYRHAIDQRYRFFSYGDAMLIHRDDQL
jgi:S-adenosylmethionine:tRNA ribosyltransferase-isomerase